MMKNQQLDRKRPILLTDDQTAMIFTPTGHLCIANQVQPPEEGKGAEVPDTNKMLAFCAWAMRQGILKVLFLNEIKRVKHKALREELEPEEIELLSVILGSDIDAERLAETRKKFKEKQQSED